MRTKTLLLPAMAAVLLLGSCVSKKKYTAIQLSNQNLVDKLADAKRALDDCNAAKASMEGRNANLQTSVDHLKEKDLQIRTMQDALDKKDSVTLALVVSLKSSLGNLNDTDVTVNVDKSVVFIELSDKMLFKSGSSELSTRARDVLAKVATVLNSKPDQEVLVEGHTDNVPISRDCIKDNWDLSASRAIAITRVLQNDYHVDPARITAAGRSQYVPKASNDTAEGRSQNRRIRIFILPKMDQFYHMIEDGLKKATGE